MRLLVVLHDLKLTESRDYTDDAEGLRWSGLLLDPQPWPVYIAREGKIGFTRDMKLKSETETDQHSRNSGDGYEELTLTRNRPTKASLD